MEELKPITHFKVIAIGFIPPTLGVSGGTELLLFADPVGLLSCSKYWDSLKDFPVVAELLANKFNLFKSDETTAKDKIRNN